MHGAATSWDLEHMRSVLDLLFAQSSLGISFHDRDLRFVYVNDTLATIGRVSAEACLGRTFPEVFSRRGTVVESYLREVRDSGTPLLARQFTDSVRHWLVSYYPVRALDGDIVGIGAVVHEETERVRAEHLLRQSEERYRVLVDSLPDALVTVADEAITFVNRAAVELIGAASKAELIGRNMWDFLHPDDTDVTRGRYTTAMTSGEFVAHEPRLRRVDGTDLVVAVRTSGYASDGRATVQAVLQDVTEQRAVEREAERLVAERDLERELLEAVLRQLPAGVVVLAADGTLLLANEQAARLWGHAVGPRAMPLAAWPAYVRIAGGEKIAMPDLPLIRALRDGQLMDDLAMEVVCADGVTRNLQGSVAPVILGDGAPRGAIATFWDVTTLTRTQEELSRARDELEARVAERTASLAETYDRLRHEVEEREHVSRQLRTAERLASVGTFAAGVAHEINNPLAAILATAELVRAWNADGVDRAELDVALARIVEEARRGGQIVKGLLRFAREEVSERWPLDVNEVVQRVCASLRGRGVLEGRRLRTRLARRLPRVVMNATELEQVLLNLLHNAVEAGGAEIVVQTADRDGLLRIAVRDDGRGIAARDQERIFDPFFTTRQQEGGTGLGLSVVHGIVTRYDGTVRVRSQPGRGATFTVELPLVAVDAQAAMIEG